MRQSQLFTKTLREAPKDEVAVNAQLLTRGGFVYKNSAGIYSYLPLGWRVVEKINKIVREEMNAIGGQEMFMPAMVERKYLDATKRWDLDVGFDIKGKKDKEANFTLGWTHEEVIASIATKYVNSYKDLPFAAYQIQTKFRNEPRAKSGLLRGREFMMKDLYSFHLDENDLMKFYEKAKEAYLKVYSRCNLQAIYTLAAGGAFTISNTHEFQVVTEAGEDTIYVCEKCRYAENNEISKLKAGDQCPQCKGKIEEKKSIEVGNIFPLGTKYSEAFGLTVTDATGNKRPVVMGSYGIGISRLLGALVEVHHDEKGMMWPESVAPYQIHLIALAGKDAKNESVRKTAEDLYVELQKKGIEVLYDDRNDKTPGEKFADSDLIGIPTRVVVSEKTLAQDGIEIKKRLEREAKVTTQNQLLASL